MNENDRELDFLRRHLRTAVPPWPDDELKRDLWPQMLDRLQEAPVRFGWFESVLVGLIVVSVAAFPELLPMMLFHL